MSTSFGQTNEPMEFEDGGHGNLADEPNPPEGKPVVVLPALVIECIYEFLSLDNVKKCRLVGRAWNLAAKKALKRRGKLVFSKSSNCQLLNSMPQDYPDDIPFKAFKIAKGNTSWTLYDFQDFFARYKNNVEELTLRNVNFAIRKFDFAPWLENNIIRAERITKLAVACSGTPVSIPLEYFVHAKDLSLKFCDVQVKAGVRIRPVKLALLYVNFLRDKMILPQVKINEFVDFSKAKEIALEFESLTYNSLELIGELKLDSLAVRDVKFENWQASKWHIDRLSMTHAPFIFGNAMEFKEMEFSYGDIDLEALPLALEKLSICNIGGFFEMSSDRPVFFPDLKYVNLKFGNEDSGDIICRFLDCPNLVEMDLEGTEIGYQEYIEQVKIIFIWVPKSVKKLTLKNVHFSKRMEEDILDLEELILIDYRYHDRNNTDTFGINIEGSDFDYDELIFGDKPYDIFEGTMGMLQVNTLRLLGDRNQNVFRCQEEFQDFVARINIPVNRIHRVYAGTMYFWENPEY